MALQHLWDHEKKLHPDPMQRNGTAPFKYSLRYLSKLRDDKWLMKDVSIKYFNKRSLVFYGQISCISSNGQIRLQYIRYHTMKDINEYIDTFHTFWFHYKQIVSVVYKKKDITDEILDILKLKMAQSFIYYYNVETLANHNIVKVINDDYTDEYMNELLAMGNGILINTELALKTRKFLYDVNRANKHLLLKQNVYLNEQRRQVEWTVGEFVKIVNNYKELFVQQITKHLNHTNFYLHMKEASNVKDEDTCMKQQHTTYLLWDNIAIENETKKELKRSENTIALVGLTRGNIPISTTNLNKIKFTLYDTSPWGRKIVKPWIRNPRRPPRTNWKWIPEQNRYISSMIKKKKVNRQTNRFHHGKKHHLTKKYKKKQKRLHARQEMRSQIKEF
eukprot:56507_1